MYNLKSLNIMNRSLMENLEGRYSNNSQIIRILTENWVQINSYCPNCGENTLNKFPNNQPVADFVCPVCNEEYELKSKCGNLSKTVPDGAYSTMIERINSKNNPNFFFLTYSKQWQVNNFIIVPKQFLTFEQILKRPPLREGAKRAGWVGCNVDISKIPDPGKIFLIREQKEIDKKIVREQFKNTLFLRKESDESKGWILDILNCIDKIPGDCFTINDVYFFQEVLKQKHPENNFIKEKIRQQLQILRKKEIIEFKQNGNYRKIRPF